MSASSPRWRWELAQRASQFPDHQAVFELRDADAATLAAYKYARASKKCIGFLGPEEEAFHIFSKRMHIKRYIECMLLAGCKDNELIAEMTDTSPRIVQIFHDFFFDVRPRLHKEGWIAEQFFGGETYKPLARHDTDGLYHRIAWLGGVTLYRAMIGRPTPELKEQIAIELSDILKQLLQRQCLLIAQTLGHGGELGLETMKMALETTTAAIKDAIPEHVKEVSVIEQQMQKFLSQVPLSVADPDTQISLLTADGFEPRALIPQTIKEAKYVEAYV